MRPYINGKLEERLREQAEERGFDNAGDLARFAVRKDLEEHS